MKYAIIIPDGAADEPLSELADRTPLEAADTPNIDWLATNGRCGAARLAPRKAPFTATAALLTLMGYDPAEHPIAGAPLEALGWGLPVQDHAWLFRCNFVTIIDKILVDATAGGVSTEEARRLIDELNQLLDGAGLRLHCGWNWRHLVTCQEVFDVTTRSPYRLVGRRVARFLPTGRDAARLRDVMQQASEKLAKHDINGVRRDLGESPVTDIWLWDPGRLAPLPAFAERFGLSGAVATGDPLMRGLCTHIGWEPVDITSASAYTGANLVEQVNAAVAAVATRDIVCVHTTAPDAAALAGDAKGKVAVIEAIDRLVVGPLIRRLRDLSQPWRMLLCPAHATLCAARQRSDEPVPFVIAGEGVHAVIHQPYNEQTAAASDLHIRRGCDLMEFFLTVR